VARVLYGRQGRPVNLQIDAAYDQGKVRQSGFRSVDYTGYAGRVKIDYPFEKFNFGMTAMYASGSDRKKTEAVVFLAQPTGHTTADLPTESQAGWSRWFRKRGGNGESVVIYGMEARLRGQGWAVNHNYDQMSKGAFGGTWFAKLAAVTRSLLVL